MISELIKLLEWPAHCPDINVMEDLGTCFQKYVKDNTEIDNGAFSKINKFGEYFNGCH